MDCLLHFAAANRAPIHGTFGDGDRLDSIVTGDDLTLDFPFSMPRSQNENPACRVWGARRVRESACLREVGCVKHLPGRGAAVSRSGTRFALNLLGNSSGRFLDPTTGLGHSHLGDVAGIPRAMSTTAEADSSADALSDVLRRVAANEGQARHLHEILGGYCHQSRNLLNCMNMSLYLARRGADPCAQSLWKEVERRYRGVEQFIDRLQSICRPMPVCVVRLPLSLLFEDRKGPWSEHLEAVGRRLLLEPPAEPAVGCFDPIRLGQALDDLVAWRVRVGNPDSGLRVRWTSNALGFQLQFDEPASDQPGTRGAFNPESRAESFDTLTVALLTRVMTLHGGRLEIPSTEGWRIELRWPLDARNTEREAP